MSAIIVIPARYESSRFPGKVLARNTGKYLIKHVYEKAVATEGVSRVLIATDDARVVQAAESFNADVCLTSTDHTSGTDRIAEAVAGDDAEIVINLQGDEPEIDPAHLGRLIRFMQTHKDVQMATLAAPIMDDAELSRPEVVKVVVDKFGRALYFSRLPIPAASHGKTTQHLRHIGVYGYQRGFLQTFVKLETAKLEKCESLEQLRALENGFDIHVIVVDSCSEGIDTPEQYQAFTKRYQAAHE